MPFFESLTKKQSAMMDDLFKWANKYSMLEDDVHAATQQVLVTNCPTKHDKTRNSKPSNQLRQASKRWDGHQQQNRTRLTLLSISYERLLPRSTIYSTLGGLSQLRQIRLNGIKTKGAPIIRIMAIPPSNVGVSITWWKS